MSLLKIISKIGSKALKELTIDGLKAEVKDFIKQRIAQETVSGIAESKSADPAASAALLTFEHKFNAAIDGKDHGMGTAYLLARALCQLEGKSLYAQQVRNLVGAVDIADAQAKGIYDFLNMLDTDTHAEKMLKPAQDAVTSLYHSAYDWLPDFASGFAKEHMTPDLTAVVSQKRMVGADIRKEFDTWVATMPAHMEASALKKIGEKINAAVK